MYFSEFLELLVGSKVVFTWRQVHSKTPSSIPAQAAEGKHPMGLYNAQKWLKLSPLRHGVARDLWGSFFQLWVYTSKGYIKIGGH